MLERQLVEMGANRLLHKYNDAEHSLHLQQLLERQNYRLAFWRVASEKLNYRRFFDVTELVGLRVELPEVFEVIHRLPLSLIADGKVTGLRVDHPDGLWDPAAYFQRLQAASRRCSWALPFLSP